MGKFCCVPGCNNRANRDKFDTKGQTIGYFQFPPENDPRRAVWIRNIRRDPGPYFSISGTTCVCSMHFEEEYIERLAISTGFRLRLTKEAIPTIFSWNQKEGGGDDTEGYAHPEPDSDEMNGDGEGDDTNGDYEESKEANGHDEGGEGQTPSKRKMSKPQPRASKAARTDHAHSSPQRSVGKGKYAAGAGVAREFGSKEESDQEIVRLRTAVQVFERKFAEMSRLVNELRSTTIKMLGVMSAGTNQSSGGQS
ncbi:uncharacterized protein LOC129598812 [Paramacrobiotus metropolitanus]|uniref:uncharacterized protein LOC129598812 n=1 Tax=Paramacrobiotus metropolitanus TaxID=2943436 RepID=UPI002445BE56|nr:uncharacterized protein LOC129598812 [Paramacrobiotus metropolitanus]